MYSRWMEQLVGMNYCYWHYPFDHFLHSMETLGFKNIEIWGGSPHFYFPDFTDAMYSELNKKIESHGLKSVCFTPEQVNYPYNIAAKEDFVRRRSVEYFLGCVDATAKLHAPLMVCGPGWGYLSEEKEAAWERSRTSLKQIADYAYQVGVTIALEALTVISSNLINYAQDLKRMRDELAHPAVRAMLDVGQMGILGETVDDYYHQLGEIAHVHLIDGNPMGHMPPGDGILPLEEICKDLCRHGYQGFYTLEINDRAYMLEPEKAFQSALKHIKSWNVKIQ